MSPYLIYPDGCVTEALNRNAAKARVKDTENRTSKRHFGKQRLAILSKGLGRTTDTPAAGSRIRDTALERIALAHAQQDRRAVTDIQYQPSTSPLLRAYTHNSPTSPPSAKRRKQNSSSSPRSHVSSASSRNSARSSRVLRELDRSDRMRVLCHHAVV